MMRKRRPVITFGRTAIPLGSNTGASAGWIAWVTSASFNGTMGMADVCGGALQSYAHRNGRSLH